MVTSSSVISAPSPGVGERASLATVLTVWFALVVLLGVRGAFIAPPGAPPLPILLGFALPLIGFGAALGLSSSFRSWVRSADLPLVTDIQAWRFAGLGFLALMTHRLLPGAFAWPAGLGDIAIGLTAPFVARALRNDASFAQSRTFVVWNLLGILDLVVAITDGALSSMVAHGTGMTTMAALPMVLVPVYFVPLFLMLHISALLSVRASATRRPS